MNRVKFKIALILILSLLFLITTCRGQSRLGQNHDEIEEEFRNQNKKFEYPNPDVGMHFLTSNGYPVEKGKFRAHGSLLSMAGVRYGINENLSIGGGLDALLSLVGIPMFYISPQFHVELNSMTRVSGGFFYFNFIDSARTLENGILLGNTQVSIGNPYFNISGGYMREFLISSPPVNIFTLSGNARISNRFILVSENAYFTTSVRLAYFISPSTDVYAISIALRYLTNQLSITGGAYLLTALNVNGDSETVPLPMVTVRFYLNDLL